MADTNRELSHQLNFEIQPEDGRVRYQMRWVELSIHMLKVHREMICSTRQRDHKENEKDAKDFKLPLSHSILFAE
jgi:hypothetical protein